MTGPTIINRPKLYEPTDIRVSDDGEQVTLTIGNASVSFHYESALKISQMLRLHAKRAKRMAGDTSRHWSVVANIEEYRG